MVDKTEVDVGELLLGTIGFDVFGCTPVSIIHHVTENSYRQLLFDLFKD